MGPPVLLGTLPTAQTARGSGPLGGPCRTQALRQAAEPPCDAPRAASFAVQTGPKHRVASTSASTAPPTTGPALGPSIPMNPRRRPYSLHSPHALLPLRGSRASTNPQRPRLEAIMPQKQVRRCRVRPYTHLEGMDAESPRERGGVGCDGTLIIRLRYYTKPHDVRRGGLCAHISPYGLRFAQTSCDHADFLRGGLDARRGCPRLDAPLWSIAARDDWAHPLVLPNCRSAHAGKVRASLPSTIACTHALTCSMCACKHACMRVKCVTSMM